MPECPDKLNDLKHEVKMVRKTYGQIHLKTAQVIFHYTHACRATTPKHEEHIFRMKEALEIITKLRGDKHSHTMAWHDIFCSLAKGLGQCPAQQ